MIKNNLENYIKNIKNYNTKHAVITILGHVNHGKTSILNRIIKNYYTEERNITQHIKYFYINFKNNFFTFIDTPGHEDFNKIRSFSVKITDIILLVISSNDGINKQTVECINYIKINKLPSIIIINKIDLNKNFNNILSDLSKYNIIPKEWGGEYTFIYVSAKKNIGINDIMDTILKYTKNIFNITDINDNFISIGTIIESYINKKKGLITSLIVKKGIFEIGNYISTNLEKNKKIKSIISMNENIKLSIPSMPIEITGLSKIYRSGNIVYSYKKNKLYKNLVFNNTLSKNKNTNYDINTKNIEFINKDKINIILKTDVTGSCEVILKIIKKINIIETIKINIIYYNIGNININDINKSKISNSIIIGFNLDKINNNLSNMLKINNIIFKNFNIIYDFIEYINNLLDIKEKECKNNNNIIYKGLANITNIFKYPNYKIAGCKIKNGIININNNIIIVRKNINIFEGKIKSIKIFNTNVDEVKENNECGIIFYNFNDIRINDLIKSY